jgi:hypothetical protein
MGFFDGIENVRASFDASYIKHGIYWCKINRVKEDTNRNKVGFVAVEMTVVRVVQTEAGKAAHRVGEEVSALFMSNQDGYLARFKRFIANVMGITVEQVTAKGCELVVAAAQPLANSIVEVEGKGRVAKKTGKDVTGTVFHRTVPIAEVKAYVEQAKAAEVKAHDAMTAAAAPTTAAK